MSGDQAMIQKAVEKALSGKGAHVATQNLFEGLDWKLAGERPAGAPHTIFELLGHMTYWMAASRRFPSMPRQAGPRIPRRAAGRIGWPP
jgi:hypothetical protein